MENALMQQPSHIQSLLLSFCRARIILVRNYAWLQAFNPTTQIPCSVRYSFVRPLHKTFLHQTKPEGKFSQVANE